MELTKSDIKAIARSQYRESTNFVKKLLAFLFSFFGIALLLAILIPDPYGAIPMFIILGFVVWKSFSMVKAEDVYLKKVTNEWEQGITPENLSHISKKDVAEVGLTRYVNSLNKKNFVVCLILAVFIIPCAFLPEPYDKVGMIIFLLPIFIYMIAIQLKEDRFVKDFVKRWESGEITFEVKQ